jgi:MOSC domain-containing protein YiiM
MADILHLYLSPGHNFFGHHGQAPGSHPMVEHEAVECVAGRGLRGDRFFDYKNNYKGQVTFFAQEVAEELGRALGVTDRPLSVFRRNIITHGLDLNALIGRQFLLGGVHFEGTEESSPCHWMDQVFAPGANAWLNGRGGLRARILSNGVLRRGPEIAWEVLAAALV